MIYTFDNKDQYIQAWKHAMVVGIEFRCIPVDYVIVVPVDESVYVDDRFQQILN